MIGGVELRRAGAGGEPPQQLLVDGEASPSRRADRSFAAPAVRRAPPGVRPGRRSPTPRAAPRRPRACRCGSARAPRRRGTCGCSMNVHQSPACSGDLQRLDGVGAAELAERFDGGQVELRKLLAIHLPDEIAEQRRGALIAHVQHFGEQRLAGAALARIRARRAGWPPLPCCRSSSVPAPLRAAPAARRRSGAGPAPSAPPCRRTRAAGKRRSAAPPSSGRSSAVAPNRRRAGRTRPGCRAGAGASARPARRRALRRAAR